MRIIIIGLGYVGLTTGLGLAQKGHEVIGYDTDKKKAISIRNGNVPFYEPNLDTILKKTLKEGTFKVKTNK